jgi:hypothetical protein
MNLKKDTAEVAAWLPLCLLAGPFVLLFLLLAGFVLLIEAFEDEED